MSVSSEIREIVSVMPGITAREIYELMPHATNSNTSSTLHNLKVKGVLTTGTKVLDTKKGPRKFTTYSLNTDLNSAPPVPKRKLNKPTEAGLAAQVEQLKATVRELEAWKQSAISRFPDLDVDPIVLKARKLVADEVHAGGDTLLANHIIEGKKDDTMLVKVAIKALEEAGYE